MTKKAADLYSSDETPQADERRHARPENPVTLACNSAHVIVKSELSRQCKACSTPKDRQRTTFFCNGCDTKPFLHPNSCFQKYHSK